MSRFLLSSDAMRDLEEIRAYLDSIPDRPALNIARKLQARLESIGDQPLLGARQSALTLLLDEEIALGS